MLHDEVAAWYGNILAHGSSENVQSGGHAVLTVIATTSNGDGLNDLGASVSGLKRLKLSFHQVYLDLRACICESHNPGCSIVRRENVAPLQGVDVQQTGNHAYRRHASVTILKRVPVCALRLQDAHLLQIDFSDH